MNFIEKLEFLMTRYNLTRSSLSQKSGIPYTTIDGWYKKGYEGLKLTTLRKLADYFNTSLDYWIQDEITDPNYGKSNGFIVDYDEVDHIKKYRELDAHGKRIVDSVLNEETRRMADERVAKEKESKAANEAVAPTTKTIPLFGASFAAGKGEPDFGNMWEDYEVPTDTKADFAVHINGDSMEPYLHDGSIALGRRQTPRDGDVGAFLLDGEFLVKQVRQDLYDNIYLFSLNRERSDADVTIWHDSGRSLRCFGTIVMKERVPLPTE